MLHYKLTEYTTHADVQNIDTLRLIRIMKRERGKKEQKYYYPSI